MMSIFNRLNILEAVQLIKLPSQYLNRHASFNSAPSFLRVNDEVKEGLSTGKPVVALESTILTHGMPYPDNLGMATSVEKEIRNGGGIPATIALFDGRAHIGLTISQLERVASETKSAMKVSRRDLAYALNKGVVGGTTISGTMVLAHMAGIKIFVSGGLGGVHRGGEDTMDVSADLTELGKTPVAVITSGVKSILDIGRTLEYLETQGICVATFGKTTEFPAFFSSKSGYNSSCNVETVDEAAKLISTTFNLNLSNGILIANPIPKEFEMDGKEIEKSIQIAVQEANEKGIVGKKTTPYILQRVNELTCGASLNANIALVKNNAIVGAKIAKRFSEINKNYAMTGFRQSFSTSSRQKAFPKASLQAEKSKSRPIVIGACGIDTILHMKSEEIKMNGPTNMAQTAISCGGVGRNLCDALTRLGIKPRFLTVLGKDIYGAKLLEQCSHMDWSLARILEDHITATYTVVLSKHGDVFLGLGDFDIHSQITPQYIESHEEALKESSCVVLDGNVSVKTIEIVGKICRKHALPLFYEPTDIDKSTRPFEAGIEDVLLYIKPNMIEMLEIVKLVTGKSIELPDKSSPEFLSHLAEVSFLLLKYVPNLILTLGAGGLLFCSRNNQLVGDNPKCTLVKKRDSMIVIHVPSERIENIKSLSGAGDCLASAFLYGILNQLPVVDSLLLGTRAAALSAQHYDTVPESISTLRI